MFLKHKKVEGQDTCPIHGDARHEYEFIRYNVAKNRVVVRLRCFKCKEAELGDWEYYESTAQHWLEFLISNSGHDFTGAS